MAVVVATGITATGAREVLGPDVGDSEDEVSWRRFLPSLRQRGLGGVLALVPKAHHDMVAAVFRTSWTGCDVKTVGASLQPGSSALVRAPRQERWQPASSNRRAGSPWW